MKTTYLIFNESSGRFLEDWQTGDYLSFPLKALARGYINIKGLNPEVFKVKTVKPC